MKRRKVLTKEHQEIYDYLCTLNRPFTASEISWKFHIQSKNVCGVINAMSKYGYIRKVGCTDNHRNVWVAI